jgi:hypothetical protein
MGFGGGLVWWGFGNGMSNRTRTMPFEAVSSPNLGDISDISN